MKLYIYIYVFLWLAKDNFQMVLVRIFEYLELLDQVP